MVQTHHCILMIKNARVNKATHTQDDCGTKIGNTFKSCQRGLCTETSVSWSFCFHLSKYIIDFLHGTRIRLEKSWILRNSWYYRFHLHLRLRSGWTLLQGGWRLAMELFRKIPLAQSSHPHTAITHTINLMSVTQILVTCGQFHRPQKYIHS